MIQPFTWQWPVHDFSAFVQLLQNAHGDLSNIEGWLRDPAVQIWTEKPSDPSKVTGEAYSLEGWRMHFGTQRQRVNQILQAQGAALLAYDPTLHARATDFVAGIAAVAPTFQSVVGNYGDGQGNTVSRTVSQADRTALADAIAAQLA